MTYDGRVRERAVHLRRKGLSYREIQLQLGVAKSTLSVWLSSIPLDDSHRASMQERARGVSATRADTNRALRARRRADAKSSARAEVGSLDASALFVAGVVAYWAEGAKPKPWRVGQPVQFTNSDAGLIRLFLAWLRMVQVADDRLGFRLLIHESADVGRAVAYWSEVVGVPASAVTVTLKHHNPRTVRKNTGADYHGCLVVSVRRSSHLNVRIAGWCEGLAAQAGGLMAAGSLGGESGVV